MQILTDYQGRQVRLTDERLRHIHEHPEMIGLDSAIAETLSKPQTVIESISDPQAELLYRYYLGTRVGDKWLCVVVKSNALDAFVVTAYLTDKPKQGVILWPPNP
ncbi:MAG: hypothetical protein AABZ08_00970 [Planctomycetota bacterium]